ncbi:MAG: glycosyltransferase [Spirochaetaceae bacterium]|nr:glycosyltransferase [Spirochaetaceae bacterium]
MINLTEQDITKNWKSEEIIVSINTLTYNHEKYIAQCIEGILMQKTNFAFELLIHDDASTDNTAAIIKEYEKKYPKIIKPIYQTENQWSKGIKISATYQYPRAKGKYIAFCEGDDYWIDENKLQMQVDILEANPEATICYCRVQTFEGQVDKHTIPLDKSITEGFVNLKDFTTEEFKNGHWTFHTSSFFIRKEILIDFANKDNEKFGTFPYGDMPVQLFALCKGKGFFIDKIMSKYRLFSGGYNSIVLAHPEKRINDEKKLIQALTKFDEFSEFKYHEDIECKIKRSHFFISKQSRDKKYAKQFISKKEYISIFYPTIYKILRKIKKLFNKFFKK